VDRGVRAGPNLAAAIAAAARFGQADARPAAHPRRSPAEHASAARPRRSPAAHASAARPRRSPAAHASAARPRRSPAARAARPPLARGRSPAAPGRCCTAPAGCPPLFRRSSAAPRCWKRRECGSKRTSFEEHGILRHERRCGRRSAHDGPPLPLFRRAAPLGGPAGAALLHQHQEIKAYCDECSKITITM
jgi:hypothetical protein